MKKTIAMLLLTALCMTVLTSCDLGNGLVAELFGDLNQEDVIVEDVILDDVIFLPPEQWGTVEVETTPSVEIETWEETIQEYWSEDIGVAYPDVLADFVIHTIEFNRPSITEVSSVNSTVLGTQHAVNNDLISLSLVGIATLYAGDCTVGYRIGEECIFDESFWGDGTDSEPEYRNLRIEIPAEQLADGYNEITLVYEMGGVIYEIGSVVVFKEVPTTEIEYEYPVDPEVAPEETIEG